MARPRIFVSSTYYDLKHVRSSLDTFIESLGFESVLSEKGNIAYAPDVPLDESCYRELANVDIFVLIVGGRYGSAASGEDQKASAEFFDRYDSITKKEYDSAVERGIPTYILVETSVYSEFQTYLRNRDDTKTQYAHVDSVNIFRLLADILSKPRNNPVHTFERLPDIEGWLREQWSGLFRELLQRMTGEQEIATLSVQVQRLEGINETLQRYLETIMKKVSPEEAPQMIETERKRLEELEQLEKIRGNPFFTEVLRGALISPDQFRYFLLQADSVDDLAGEIAMTTLTSIAPKRVRDCAEEGLGLEELNELRELVGREKFAPYSEELKHRSD
ncbi:MAG: DUF4062 domain-containing protein [Planctomycetota bacterium]|jgi:hypothetical protein